MRQMIVIALATGLLLGCTDPEPETYPITGGECGPNDPVKDLDASDCVPPVQG